jgi:hypothetical protein
VKVELDDSGSPVLVTHSCSPAPLHLCTAAPYNEQVEESKGDVARNTAGAELQTSPQATTATEQRCRSLTVETILEIWLVDDEWWREPIARRYVEVILEGGKHVVLYEDLATSGWFMQMP